MDRIDDFSIPQNRDGSRVNVTDVNRIVACYDDIAAARRWPRLDEVSVFIENGDALIVAVGNKQPALGVNRDSVRQLKLAGSVAFNTTNDFDELSVL
jgi:hypothetical protein